MKMLVFFQKALQRHYQKKFLNSSFYITTLKMIDLDPSPGLSRNVFMIVHKLDENKPLCFSDQVADQVVVAMYHISQAYSKLHIQSHACHPSEK